MKFVKILLAVIVLALSGYGLLNSSVNLTYITLFFLGALLLTMGGEVLKKGNKPIGYLLIIISLFNFFVSIENFFLT